MEKYLACSCRDDPVFYVDACARVYHQHFSLNALSTLDPRSKEGVVEVCSFPVMHLGDLLCFFCTFKLPISIWSLRILRKK